MADDPEQTATLPPAATLAPAPRDGPPADWERYEVGELLGEGGMGTVYRARDRRLDRPLALKFLRGSDPSMTLRLLREARAQALLDHPNVCRVYEVGEVRGRAYLALQLIHGEPLHVAGARMALGEQLAVMRDVARAIAAAHELGIIHRDLKPANILVERTADRGLRPVVMDFGLARELGSEAGLTVSGAVLGTPAYMAPEQARGDAVDHRADLYALGATLYELVTGRPVFGPAPLAETLARVIHDEPVAPRKLAPALPADVETVVLKCLAKDPAQRYGSARALAEDLARCLAGEPIVGRRAPRWRRWRQRARRHRAAVALAAAALAIIAVLAGLGARSWLVARDERARAAARVQLAERLGGQRKEIELWMRSAHQRPLHDTRPDRARVRAQMRAIAATPHELGDAGDAAIHAALGQGALALHAWREAEAELARAASLGLATPELHAARGRALAELYGAALEAARRSGDPAWLAARAQALAARYLAPAQIELALAVASDDAALVEVRMALVRRDHAAAEQLAGALIAHAAWPDEAYALAGDAAYARANDAFDRGDYAAAQAPLARATASYAAAGDIARSDAAVHEAAARGWLARAEVEYRQGGAPRAAIDQAIAAIDRALVAEPDDAAAHTTQAYVLLRWFRTPALRGDGDQVPLLEHIAQAAARAVELDPRDARAWDALGNAHLYRGLWEGQHGGDEAAWWRRALDELDRAVAADPDDPWANNDLGAVHRWLGDHLEQTGGDALPEYAAALRGYRRAAQLDPRYVFAWSNQADVQIAIAERAAARGEDPRAALAGAAQAGERALALDPSYYALLDTLAQAQLTRAQYEVDRGADPAATLAQARGYLDRAAAVQRDNMVTAYYRGLAAELEARGRLHAGGDPAPAIAAARAALDEARRLAPRAAIVYAELARLGLVEVAARRDPGAAGAAAARAIAQAIALNPRSADAELTAADIDLADRDPAAVARGLAHVARAVALHPGLPRAAAVRAALEARAR
ncbi:MAG TPA: serine/threonine-protein kinase [Kofleriaceae bacterium]